MEKALNYSDIYLVPEYSELKSRAEADIGVEFLGKRFNSPVVPANMSSVIDINTARWLSENEYFYIFHRFGETLSFIRNSQTWNTISISVGVKQEDKNLILRILNILDYYGNINKGKFSPCRVDFITIDIAHGHHLLVKEMILFIKNSYKENNCECPKIIAGNVCTPEAVADLESWGADAVKVGIGGGGACSTKNMTGFHFPMFSCLLACCDNAHVPIIADGGCRENGDIAKSIACGATLSMVGGALAACINSPAENIYSLCSINPDIKSIISHKKYFGSASFQNKKENKNIEGFEVEIPCNGLNYAQKYQEIKESLQSAISYSGGKSLSDLRKVTWITTK